MELLSVNIGRARVVSYTDTAGGFTGIDKRPVAGPVAVASPGPSGAGGSGLAGDTVSDARHHGGADQAVYAFAREDLDRWEAALGRELAPGVAVTATLLVAIGAAAVSRARPVRLFLTILSPAALLFPIMFITTTPAGRLLSPALVVGTGEGAASAQIPIVMVVFDEMGSLEAIGADGRIDARRFPHLAALAETSTWFPNAIGADPFTGQAVPVDGGQYKIS